ncbi:hypothetical protein ACLOJK_025663 [Asimina triloba]
MARGVHGCKLRLDSAAHQSSVLCPSPHPPLQPPPLFLILFLKAADFLNSLQLASDAPSKLHHLRFLRELLMQDEDSSLLAEFLPRLLQLQSQPQSPIRKLLAHHLCFRIESLDSAFSASVADAAIVCFAV